MPSLRALALEPTVEIVGVFTRPPVPAGRGSKLTPTEVAETARELNLPLLEADSVVSGPGREALARVAPDLLVVVAYGEILPADVLALPRLGCVNLHFSLLPAYRGAAPVQRALLDGLTQTGVSVMLLDEGTDTGPVLAREACDIFEDDDSGSLGARLAELGGAVLARTLSAMAAGEAPPAVPQDETGASLAPRIGRRAIDWDASANEIRGLVRALGPTPGATTTFRGAGLKVLRVEVTEDSGPAGRLLVDEPAGPVIGTASGGIRLLEVAPAGRKRMPGADFARGARLGPREAFGESS